MALAVVVASVITTMVKIDSELGTLAWVTVWCTLEEMFCGNTYL